MRYSVIMPVYNKAPYVEAAVRSALAEDLLYELIIVDDGSTDGSGDICDRLAREDSRITVIHQQNSGVSAARNTAIEQVTGDYVFFLDGDDLICPRLFAVAEEILTPEKHDAVFFSYEKRFEDGGSQTIGVPLTGKQALDDISKIFYSCQRDCGFFGCVSAKLIRSEIIKSERFDTQITLAEDFDYWMRIYPKIKTAYFDDFCSFVYINGVAESSIFAKVDYFSQLDIRLRYKDFLIHNNFVFDKAQLEQQLAKYKYFCIYYAESTLQAVKRLRSNGQLHITSSVGLSSAERAVLWLCSHRLSAVAAVYICIKKGLGRIKRWLVRR